MKHKITIVDYGAGNLFSVRRAVEVSGGVNIKVSSSASDIDNAEKIILPGVGAFENGMSGLRARGLIEPLLTAAYAGKPLLGICLGMQMLASLSEEFGTNYGLDLIPGTVKEIPRISTDGRALKVPYIGWAPLILTENAVNGNSYLSHMGNRSVYFVHSFHVTPHDTSHLLAGYLFGGNLITAVIRKNNVTGVQFHPEKSGAAGIAILSSFIGQGSVA